MNETEVDAFERTEAQMCGLYEEMRTLSKKKADDAVNKFKLRFINEVLGQTNKLLGAGYVPFEEFRQFDEDDLPTNSDVVLILSQYLRQLDNLLKANVVMYHGDWRWVIDRQQSERRARAPQY